ncbi:MAG: DUF4406 domain-containing protein [Atopobiaceae bacterium]|nr:DUF4406 domain-containing protein [Atopobiaceae bacterium]MBR3158478.1 DUF4406 domain-containing protein [Atopobiaceae bacterium]
MCDFKDKRVYLSGAMTGMHDWNRDQFAEAARYIRSQGAAHVFNPAFLAPYDVIKAKKHESYMIHELHELTSNMDGKPFYDVLAQLPGWDKSYGAQVEQIVAMACGIEVVSV